MQRAQGGLNKSDAAITGRRAGSLTGREDGISMQIPVPVQLGILFHCTGTGGVLLTTGKKRSRRIKTNPATAPPAQHLVTNGWDYRQQIEVGFQEFVLFEVELQIELKVKMESRSQSPAPTTFDHQLCSASQAAREYSCVVVAVSRSVV